MKQESDAPPDKSLASVENVQIASTRGGCGRDELERVRGDMANGKKDGHPKKDFNALALTARKALNLASAHKSALEPRLPAGTLDGLTADLQKLGVELPGTLVIRSTATTATKSQNEALSQGYSLVTAIRTAVQRRGATADVRAAYGVGAKTSEKVVKQVVAAITLILERAADQPGEAAALGILQKDLEALAEDRAAISSADGAQEAKRAGAPVATKERNRTASRILGAVDVIVAAGVVEFAKDEDVRGEFEALVGGGGKGKKKGKAAEAEGKKVGAKKEVEEPAGIMGQAGDMTAESMG